MSSAGTTKRADLGNVLGGPRAEADQFLHETFIETPEYRTLASTYDFNFVVGRRGTGKSALFQRLFTYNGPAQERPTGRLTIARTPQEHESVAFKGILSDLSGTYVQLRYITKLVWQVHVLLLVAQQIVDHYKLNRTEQASELRKFLLRHDEISRVPSELRCARILDKFRDEPIHAIPARIATFFDVDNIGNLVAEALREVSKTTVIGFDRLDEGWEPDTVSTAILGGLAQVAAAFSDRDIPIHVVLFVRDNMFRAMSFMDSDFSRTIEGSSLRLRWDEASLFHLATTRIRRLLGMENTENDTRVWNLKDPLIART